MQNGQGSNPNKLNRRIPGPAGLVQVAMERRARGKMPESEWIPTQEYLDKVTTEPEYDDAFNKAAWQNTLSLGYQDIEGYTTFADVRSLQGKQTTNRVPLAMGMVTKVDISDDMKSLLIELKDQTDTMNASVHHSAILENDFVGKIVVGSVIVISNCVVFKPEKRPASNMYFNIVKVNLLMLIGVDGEYYVPKV